MKRFKSRMNDKGNERIEKKIQRSHFKEEQNKKE
jgi:hypothetical protein